MRKFFKWLAIVFGGFIGILIILVIAFYAFGTYRLNKNYNIEAAAINIPNDQTTIQRGAYIYFYSCEGCHGTNLAGKLFFEDPAIGSIPSSNLTSGFGGIGSTYSDDDYVRAIRHGIRADGKPLIIMPARSYWYFSDEDLGAVIAFLKNAPAVDNDPGTKKLKPLGRILLAVDAFGNAISAESIDHLANRPSVPIQSVSVEYGEYLVNTGDCRECHGAELNGAQGPEPDSPPSPNLTVSGTLGSWTAEDFIEAMRNGTTPEGGQLDPAYMPWEVYRNLNDDDLTAIYLYLTALQPITAAK